MTFLVLSCIPAHEAGQAIVPQGCVVATEMCTITRSSLLQSLSLLCWNLFQNRSNGTSGVIGHRRCHNVNCTNSALSLNSFCKSVQLCSLHRALSRGLVPWEGDSGQSNKAGMLPTAQAFTSLRDSWTVDTVLFYDSSCPTFQRALESSCLQFALRRNCCLKFFRLSLPQAYISN